MKKGLIFTGILLNWVFFALVFFQTKEFTIKVGAKDVNGFIFLFFGVCLITVWILHRFKKELRE